jgi:hypothetical protein
MSGEARALPTILAQYIAHNGASYCESSLGLAQSVLLLSTGGVAPYARKLQVILPLNFTSQLGPIELILVQQHSTGTC